tara:strand:+ start:22 stop:339 length:318 start_codon:yes stop_codon:yes gene_type:complete
MNASFYSRDTLFVDNISSHYEIFDVYDKGDEYVIELSPKNYEDLKKACEVIVKYSKDYDDMLRVTSEFLEEGYLNDYFIELFGKEKGNKIVDDAIEYSKSLFNEK